VNDVQALRATYEALRVHGAAHTGGWAYLLWSRVGRTSFIVSADGECVANDRVTLLAQFRTMLLRQGFPVEYVAKFDRTDV
jgi:hypothetical protein